jgi:hypothetical protein
MSSNMFVPSTYEPVQIYVGQVVSVDVRCADGVKQSVASAARLACALSSSSMFQVKDLIIVTSPSSSAFLHLSIPFLHVACDSVSKFELVGACCKSNLWSWLGSDRIRGSMWYGDLSFAEFNDWSLSALSFVSEKKVARFSVCWKCGCGSSCIRTIEDERVTIIVAREGFYSFGLEFLFPKA